MMINDKNDVDRLQAVWRDFRAYLEYERDEGHARIIVMDTTRQRVESWAAPPQSRASSAKAVTAPPVSSVAASSISPETSEASTLGEIARDIAACTRCDLSRTRTNTVPGHGHPRPQLLFIGEAPGEEEDRQGLPFVGRSGALLTRMIKRMGLSRDEVFIANILKCRPPGNRTPTSAERETCRPFLERQIATLSPAVIVILGATALHGLLQVETAISQSRGVWHEYRGIPVMPTYHPSYLLRNLKARFDTWDDMLQVLDRIGRRPPPIDDHKGKS